MGSDARRQARVVRGRIGFLTLRATVFGVASFSVHVRLHHPRRDVEVAGPLAVRALLAQLGLRRDSVLVIRGEDLVMGDDVLADDDAVEIRPVISGGAAR